MVAQIDRDYRKAGIARAVRRLASYGLFEGRPLTTRGRWLNPFVFAWLHTLNRLGEAPRVRQPIFIVGLGRSGTTILGLLLSLHKDVGFLNEPKALWHVIDPRQDVNGNYGGVAPVYRMGSADVTDVGLERAHRIFGRYLQLVGAGRLVDKYPENVFRVAYVKKIFPDARFIFIHRSGVDATDSIVKWSEREGRVQRGHLEDWWGRDDCKWIRIWEQLLMTDMQRYGELQHLEPRKLDHANRAALEWIVTMREGLDAYALHSGTVVKLAYEHLVERPREELAALLASCDLPNDDAIFKYAAKRLYDNPPKSRPTLLPPVQRLFDETMVALGY